MKIFLLILTLSITGLICQDNSAFEWTDPVSGTKYDFSGLKKSPEYI